MQKRQTLLGFRITMASCDKDILLEPKRPLFGRILSHLIGLRSMQNTDV